MSDRIPPRRRIAGEAAAESTPGPAPARKPPVPRKRPSAKRPADDAATTSGPSPDAATPQSATAEVEESTSVRAKNPVKRPVSQARSSTGSGAAARTRVVPPAAAAPASSTSADGTARGASRRTPVLAVLAALVLLGGAVVGWLGLQHWLGEPFADSRAEAVSTASSATETIFSFRFDNLDEHTEQSKALMTPSFADQFDQIAPALTDIAPERKVVVEAVTRNAAALPCGDECSPDQASVLVFLDQDRRTSDDDTSTVFGNRIVVDLVKSDGRWLVDDIRAL